MTTAGQIDDARARANALRLAIASALAGANASVIFATGAIVGSVLAPDKSYATVPISIFVVGMALATLPVGWIARTFGRRTAFQIGSLMGVIGGLLGASAVYAASFPLYCLGTLCCGSYAAAAQSYRFAAADTASESYKPKVISWVMAGGVLAGFVGPQLVQNTMNLWPPYLFAASYVGQSIVAALAMIVLSTVDFPKPAAAAAARAGRPLLEIAAQPRFVVAALCGVVSYALMNLIMTAAPLAMKMCGHDISDSNLAIQWHVVAMYLPSFVTGSLIARYGADRVVTAGLLLTGLAGIVGLMGITVAHFWTALIILGVGWNFGFVGASAMVVTTHRPEERTRVQSFNDFLVFGTMAVGSFSSGHVLTNWGWSWVNLIAFPPIALALVALVWFALARARRPAA
ncbi:MAG: MFS transporter [Rhizobiales bacterium]|nr:MFS transporter [Hyphomicrobiales bacterium]